MPHQHAHPLAPGGHSMRVSQSWFSMVGQRAYQHTSVVKRNTQPHSSAGAAHVGHRVSRRSASKNVSLSSLESWSSVATTQIHEMPSKASQNPWHIAVLEFRKPQHPHSIATLASEHFRWFVAKEEGLHHPFPFDLALAAGNARKTVAKQTISREGDMDAARL